MSTIVLDIPYSTFKLLRYYANEGVININEFIIDSVNNHIDNIEPNSPFAREVGKLNLFPVAITVIEPLTSYLGLFSARNGISVSQIVTEALGHSLSHLIEEGEFIEDISIEELKGGI